MECVKLKLHITLHSRLVSGGYDGCKGQHQCQGQQNCKQLFHNIDSFQYILILFMLGVGVTAQCLPWSEGYLNLPSRLRLDPIPYTSVPRMIPEPHSTYISRAAEPVAGSSGPPGV